MTIWALFEKSLEMSNTCKNWGPPKKLFFTKMNLNGLKWILNITLKTVKFLFFLFFIVLTKAKGLTEMVASQLLIKFLMNFPKLGCSLQLPVYDNDNIRVGMECPRMPRQKVLGKLWICCDESRSYFI